MSMTILPFIILAGFILFSTFKILNEYERGVILRLGKFRRQGAWSYHPYSGT